MLRHWNSQKAEKQRKNRTKVCNVTRTSKSQISCRKCWYLMISLKSITSCSKYFFFFFFSFLKILKLLYVCLSIQSIYSNSRFGKMYDGGNFTPHCNNYFTHIFTVYICEEQNLFKKLSCILCFFDLVWDGTWCYSLRGSVSLVLFL